MKFDALSLIFEKLNQNLMEIIQPSTKGQELQVYDIMSVEEVRVYENDQVGVVLNNMLWGDLLHVCVFNKHDELVGILHYNDARDIKHHSKKVEEIMTTEFEEIKGDVSAQDGKLAVLKNRFNCLPVIENEQVIGILNIENI